MQINFAFCMTILNCWYGTTENWHISWGISFHTNASTSVAVTNGTSYFFFRDMQLFYVTLRQNSKFGSLRLGLTFQIEHPLSCRRVWKVDLWNIYKNKILQDLCSTMTVNELQGSRKLVMAMSSSPVQAHRRLPLHKPYTCKIATKNHIAKYNTNPYTKSC